MNKDIDNVSTDKLLAMYPATNGILKRKYQLKGGHSGAHVWVVNVIGKPNFHNGLAIAKIDNYQEILLEHRAHEAAQLSSIEPHTPPILFISPYAVNDLGIIIYRLTYESIDSSRTLAELISLERPPNILADLVKKLLYKVLASWHEILIAKFLAERDDVSIEHLIKHHMNLGETHLPEHQRRYQTLIPRAQEFFALPPEFTALHFNTTGNINYDNPLPNPFAFIAQSHLFPEAGYRNLGVALGPIHGDFHGANIIYHVLSHHQVSSELPKIIDFKQSSTQGLFTLDLAYLEFDIIERAIKPYLVSKGWAILATLVLFLTQERSAILPGDEPSGYFAPGLWKIIKPIREYLDRIIREVRQKAPGAHEELEKSFWLSAMCVGLFVSRRSKSHPVLRSAGLLYAARALRCFFNNDTTIWHQDATKVATLTWYGHEQGLRVQGVQPPKATEPPLTGKDARRRYPPQFFWALPYTLSQIFIGRKQELKLLDEWANNPRENTLILQAIGGQGKSSLSWYWFNAVERTRQFEGGFWWSFYNAYISMDAFLRYAISYITGKSEYDFREYIRTELEDKLLEVLENKRILFVLDGIERLMNGYNRHDAPSMGEQESQELENSNLKDFNRFFDVRDAEFLRKLTKLEHLKILISTRHTVLDLEDPLSSLMPPNIHIHELQGLHPDDVVALFASARITGDTRKIIEFTEQFGNHGLIVNLIVGKIRENRKTFERWYETEGKKLNLHTLSPTQSRTMILRYAFEGLSPELREFMQQLALVLKYPRPFEAIRALNPFWQRYYSEPPKPLPRETYSEKRERFIELEVEAFKLEHTEPVDEARLMECKQLMDSIRAEIAPYDTDDQPYTYFRDDPFTVAESEYEKLDQQARILAHERSERDFENALQDLEDRGLLQWDPSTGLFDLHPVVRGYAAEDIDTDTKTRTLDEYRNYFESQESRPPEEVEDVNDLSREIEIFITFVEAGQLDDAMPYLFGYNVSKLSLQFELQRIGAWHEIIRLLKPIFPSTTYDMPPKVTSPEQQLSIMNAIANAYVYVDTKIERRLRELQIKHSLAEINKHRENLEHEGLETEISASMLEHLEVVVDNLGVHFERDDKLWSAKRAFDMYQALARASDDKYGIAMAQYRLMSLYVTLGQWEQVADLYHKINPEDFGEQILWHGCVKTDYAAMLVFLNKNANAMIEEASQITQQARDIILSYKLAYLQGISAYKKNAGHEAVRYFEQAIEFGKKASLDLKNGFGALAESLLLLGEREKARQLVENPPGVDDLAAAKIWLALGEKDKAIERALAAYREAWADGLPYSDYVSLQEAQDILNTLGEKHPDLPPFDENRFEKMPYEDDIRTLIVHLESKRNAKDTKSENADDQSGVAKDTELENIDDIAASVFGVSSDAGDELAPSLITPSLDIMIEQLQAADVIQRQAAIHWLKANQDWRAVDPLIEAGAVEEDAETQKQIIAALVNINAPELLIPRLKDKGTSFIAFSALDQLPQPGNVYAFIDLLSNPDRSTRSNAALALRNPGVRDPLAVQPLINTLNDEYAQVRWMVVTTLQEYKDSRAVQPIIAMLNDRIPTVRTRAAQALGVLNDASAISALIEVLRDRVFEVRQAAAHSIAQLSGWKSLPDCGTLAAYFVASQDWSHARYMKEDVIPLLVEDLTTHDPNQQTVIADSLDTLDWRPQTPIENAAYFIARKEWHKCIALGSEATIPLVKALLSANVVVRYEAARSLEALAWTPTTEAERAAYHIALKEWDHCVGIGLPAVETLLFALVYFDEADSKLDAAKALTEIGDARAIGAFKDMLTVGIGGEPFRNTLEHFLGKLSGS